MCNYLTLSHLELLEKKIDILKSTVLFNDHITPQNLDNLFITYNSTWTSEDGWLTGTNPDESAGMAIFRQDFPGNILLQFDARTVLPSTHDINFMWNGEWDPLLNSCGNAYIGSICGWYTQRIGIERSPAYKLRATCPNKFFRAGESYRVHAGSINGTCFIFINGELAIEVDDPEPFDTSRYSRIAFTAWSSKIQVKNIVIRQISWEPVTRKYPSIL